jgi:hypothetical protein
MSTGKGQGLGGSNRPDASEVEAIDAPARVAETDFAGTVTLGFNSSRRTAIRSAWECLRCAINPDHVSGPMTGIKFTFVPATRANPAQPNDGDAASRASNKPNAPQRNGYRESANPQDQSGGGA